MHHLRIHISSKEDIYVNKVNDPQSIDQGITTNRLIIPCVDYSTEQILSLYKFAKRKYIFFSYSELHVYLIQVFELINLFINH